jgi:prepilin-type N-terminal cleavage/methylation domain-containing protein
MQPKAAPMIKRGFTLLELLLVLAILVALAGIAAPTFESMVTSRRIHQTATQLRNELMEARVTAMRNGQAQVMQATLQGSDYSITAWVGAADNEDASAGATVNSASGQLVQTDAANGGSAVGDAPTVDTKNLAEGVTFSAVEMVSDSRSVLAVEQAEATGGGADASGAMSSPLMFYPDGSCTTAQIILADTRGRRVAIQVRGVVGQMSIVKLTSVDPTSVSQP